MSSLTLYCKSYRKDLKRVVRLAESVLRYNKEKIKFFISIPKQDIKLFTDYMSGLEVKIIPDEEIIKLNSNIDLIKFNQLPGSLSQQIVKSEFWRMCPTPAYLCLDSDSMFIRDFYESEYLTSQGIPYTVMTEAQELQLQALCNGKEKIIYNFKNEANTIKKLFTREGRNYSFGPMPLVWHQEVWKSLETYYLKPKRLNILDAILLYPLESRWYGEALLKYQAVPLLPCEPFFKVYHYAWQFDQDQRRGIRNKELSNIFSGVIYQSAWERDMDWPDECGGGFSILARKIRRALGKM